MHFIGVEYKANSFKTIACNYVWDILIEFARKMPQKILFSKVITFLKNDLFSQITLLLFTSFTVSCLFLSVLFN